MHDKLVNSQQISYLTPEGKVLWYRLQDDYNLDPDLAFEVLLAVKGEEEILELGE